jgi:hypothetical protein
MEKSALDKVDSLVYTTVMYFCQVYWAYKLGNYVEYIMGRSICGRSLTNFFGTKNRVREKIF